MGSRVAIDGKRKSQSIGSPAEKTMPKPATRAKPPTRVEIAEARAVRARRNARVSQNLLEKERIKSSRLEAALSRLEAKIRRLEAKLFSLEVKLDRQKRISGTEKQINQYLKAELKSLKNNRDLTPIEILDPEAVEAALLAEKRD